ncbi:MAG: hypothetical protein D4R69_02535 [Actinomycetales bacterium]|nr:MAG: hypothetical protein D4R69_02535 [Actinomycetales bacterium]
MWFWPKVRRVMTSRPHLWNSKRIVKLPANFQGAAQANPSANTEVKPKFKGQLSLKRTTPYNYPLMIFSIEIIISIRKN